MQPPTQPKPANNDTNYSLAGRVAVVTGAARGIGRSCALRLASAGADVAVLDRDLDGAGKFGEVLSADSVPAEIEALGRRSKGYEVDLVDRDLVNQTFEDIVSTFGRIDVLVNMAGGAISPIERSKASVVPDDDVDLILDVNLRTVINCSQAAIPALRDSSGVIVNVTGASAIATLPDGVLSHYGFAKMAVLQYTRSLATELGPEGIRANCVSPGITYSARVAAQATERRLGTNEDLSRIPLRRFGQPDDIAKAVEFLATDMSSYITGQCLSVCGGNVVTPN
jgi:NAD(P)-dependent dehydrogenase (short-subunit alcohol dehydrogenase family)